jgi:hypothetical protein
MLTIPAIAGLMSGTAWHVSDIGTGSNPLYVIYINLYMASMAVVNKRYLAAYILGQYVESALRFCPKSKIHCPTRII